MNQDWHLKPFSNPAFCVLPFYGIEYPANTADDADFSVCLLEIHKQDAWKKISITEYLPSFATLINII